jgi:hypothetical protein
MNRCCAHLGAGRARAHGVLLQSVVHEVVRTTILGEAEIVVRAEVEAALHFAIERALCRQQLEVTQHHVDVRPRCAADRPIEHVVHTAVKAPLVEVFEVCQQGCIPRPRVTLVILD